MSDTLTAAVRGLLRHLHSRHPVRGGSLIITLFGDAISPRAGAVTLGSLIRLARPFRLSERLIRTSVARLAQDGWLVARRQGRQSEYRLTPGGAAKFADATRRIYSPAPCSWSGSWTLLVLPAVPGGRPERLREELRWLGFGQLTPGTFAHPSCSIAQAKRQLANLPGAQPAVLLNSASDDRVADRQIAALGWDLQALAQRYQQFVQAFEPLEKVTSAEVGPEAALIIRTLLVHEYRKIHLQDPLLPAALLPPEWVGARAYQVARRLYARVFGPAEQYLSAQAERLGGPLPPTDAAAHERFGGLQITRASRPDTGRMSAGNGSRDGHRAHDGRSSK